ncbi:MAG: acyl carrier protein [Firmicutes bacterium]|nr:acyl carrier protein [Bacillota bacterium]
MVSEKVVEMLASQLNISKDKVQLNAKLIEDLGADSLDMVEMLMLVEEEFGISIPDEDAMNLKTVDDIIKYIEANKK